MLRAITAETPEPTQMINPMTEIKQYGDYQDKGNFKQLTYNYGAEEQMSLVVESDHLIEIGHRISVGRHGSAFRFCLFGYVARYHC